MRRQHPIACGLVAGSMVTVLAGCSGIADVPLPGGAAGGSTYNVTVVFDDVLDLAKQSGVRVDDVPVGGVTGITLEGFKARVTLKIKKSVVLPANAIAELRQTSLLGEKYVSLAPPPAPEKPYGRLVNNAVIPNNRAGRNAEFEEVFSALSALLNGGGLPELQTISVELSNALSGRETKVRDVLTQLTKLLGALDDRKSEIVRMIDSVDRLGARLARQKDVLARALDNIPGALKVLADQRSQLTQMLVALARLGTIGSDVIRNSKANTVADLQALQPISQNLVAAKKNLVGSLELLLNYPFPSTANNGVHGDYAGLYITLNADVTQLFRNAIAPSAGGALPTAPGGTSGGTGLPGTPGLPGLPSTPLTKTPTPPSGQAPVNPAPLPLGTTLGSYSRDSSTYSTAMMGMAS